MGADGHGELMGAFMGLIDSLEFFVLGEPTPEHVGSSLGMFRRPVLLSGRENPSVTPREGGGAPASGRAIADCGRMWQGGSTTLRGESCDR